MTKIEYTASGAKVSADEKYRYLLWREWRGTHDPKNWEWLGDEKDGAGHRLGEPKACLFIMLNPSTADGKQDDPTIRRCVAFAQAWNYERLVVANLFAYRATDPRELFALGHVDDPVGFENSSVIANASVEAGIIVCAWGAHGSYLDQDETVLGWLGSRNFHCLGRTKDGSPTHPLYLKRDAKPLPFRGRKVAA